MDKDKSARVERAEFIAACEDLGYEHDAAKLFGLYDHDKSRPLARAQAASSTAVRQPAEQAPIDARVIAGVLLRL